MKAVIQELWETGREIITFDCGGRPQTFVDLKECENVVLGTPGKVREVLINNTLVWVKPVTAKHLAGGTMRLLEVL